MQIRNVAIIAHVDHGKTTLVDSLLKQTLSAKFDATMDRVMDSGELEKERGITILSKVTSVVFEDTKINIVDTPGHADFGGEVERIMNMVDGAVLLVDAAEGPLPQTRFVLSHALSHGHKIIVVINKIDRADARPREVENEVFDLFCNLGASPDQLDFPIVYAVAREGRGTKNLADPGKDLSCLLKEIVDKVSPPKTSAGDDFQLVISQLGYSPFVGKLCIGRIQRGRIKVRDSMVVMKEDKNLPPMAVTALFKIEGLKQVPSDSIETGDIAVVAGFEQGDIGDTLAIASKPEALPRIYVTPPTIRMTFSVNTSVFAGREGSHVTSRKIRDRLYKEAIHNVAIRVTDSDAGPDQFIVAGRGEFQLAILCETMRREGYEFMIGKPEVITKMVDGVMQEPFETAICDIPDEFLGAMTELMSTRQGRMVETKPFGEGRMRASFEIPSRGLIGMRSHFLTITRGTGILNVEFLGYRPKVGEVRHRANGALVSDREGVSVEYGIFHLEDRGRFFIDRQVPVYKGMVVGENNRDTDLWVNVCREKKLSNMRAAGKDDSTKLTAFTAMPLEKALEWINPDEWVEVTPKTIRMCKRGGSPT